MLLKKGIKPHPCDCLALDPKQIETVLGQLKAHQITSIILLEDSSTTNFSLFHMLCSHSDRFPQNTKCFCNCEDSGIRTLLEDFYDNNEGSGDTGTKNHRLDLEVFSLPELQVREMFANHELNSHYEGTATAPEEQDVHLIIVGFGQVGQQVLLQAMNLGVTHRKNRILIDVVDYQMDQKRSVFANHFHSKYMEMDQNSFCLKPPAADGELQIRFHSMDVAYQEFRTLLAEIGTPVFTYAAICLQDTSLGVHCALGLQRFLAQTNSMDRAVPILLRMDSDLQMAHYLEYNKKTLAHVYTMPGKKETLSFDALLHMDRDQKAREFHRMYEKLSLVCGVPQESLSAGNQDSWHTLRLFQRDSNRALAVHIQQKKLLLDNIDSSVLMGAENSLLQKMEENGNIHFIFGGTEEELARRIHETPDIRELVAMEHRRWCYFMASQGWAWGEKKNPGTQENPCLTDWDTLYEKHPDMCKYDLLPFLIPTVNATQEDKEMKK